MSRRGALGALSCHSDSVLLAAINLPCLVLLRFTLGLTTVPRGQFACPRSPNDSVD